MKEKVMLLQILAIALLKVVGLKAECNACYAANHMACVSETTYQFCVNNVPSGTVSACPSGYVCSALDSAIICQPISAGAIATCSDCNRCSANLVFACTGVNTYALCFGQTTPSSVTASCGTNRVCNIYSQQICESSATSAATCSTGGTTATPTATTTTTTVLTSTLPTTVPTYAQYYCSVMRMNRRFAAPKEYDGLCKKYITT